MRGVRKAVGNLFCGGLLGNGVQPGMPLRPCSGAEKTWLEAFKSGRACEVNSERPEKEPLYNIIRASFVHFVLKKYSRRLDKKCVDIKGAYILGELNFGKTEEGLSIDLVDCNIDGKINIFETEINGLNLEGSVIDGLYCAFSTVNGSVILRGSFCAFGEVQLRGVDVRGDLDFSGGRFFHAGRTALNLETVRVNGKVCLGKGFWAMGEVCLQGAEVRSDVDCEGGKFISGRGVALNGARSRVIGRVLLRDNFMAFGEVRFSGAEIGGHLNCSNAKCNNDRE